MTKKIEFTSRAKDQIEKIINKDQIKKFFRISVKGGGCSGFKYNFSFDGVEGEFPGWRRYGNDGYGEDEVAGTNYAEEGNQTPGQRGRVWPFFTGERGHYELAKALKSNSLDQAALDKLTNTYIKGMELFANEGLMLPEQVWDGVGVNPQGYTIGEGTNSATPLAWTHAEYIKLLRSVSGKKVWDHYPIVEKSL